MCGIAAIYAYRPAAPPVDREELLRIRERMISRGPDGAGLWLSDDGRVGMAHRRLSIIDLSPAGAQPMADPDTGLVIVFNGEIYNYRQLRSELEAGGEHFRSHSDTEVLLKLYALHGEKLLEKLRGMYAFAIYDPGSDAAKRATPGASLFIARDPYGIKPLYYADDGETYRVASQVKALRAGGRVAGEVDLAGLAGFYLLGTIPEPYTALRAVRALPAGSWLRIYGGRTEGPHRWHSLGAAWLDARDSSPRDLSTGAVEDAIAGALRDSVRHHLVADVPVGAFLSAGIDSGALVGLMAETGQSPQTLTVAFDEFRGQPQDEAPLAAEVAAYYGAGHTVHRVSEERFRSDWPRILSAMDQPSIDGVNTWYASEAARLAGLKVAVSGLGGDELFGGYPSFRQVPKSVRTFAWVNSVPSLGKGARHLISLISSRFASPKYAGLLEYGGTFPGAWLLRRGLFMPWELPGLMGEDEARESLARLQPFGLIESAMTPDPQTPFCRVAALEAGLYMRNQLLRDADWAGMAHGIEIRVPLVDSVLLRVVAPLLLACPDPTTTGKQALALAPQRPLPEEIRRRPKTGFSVPFSDWLARIDGLDSWRRVPMLARPGCHWSRRMAYALAQDQHLWGG